MKTPMRSKKGIKKKIKMIKKTNESRRKKILSQIGNTVISFTADLPRKKLI